LTMSLQVTAHHALLVQLVQQAHTAQRAASLARMPPSMERRRVTFAFRGSSRRFRIAQRARTARRVTTAPLARRPSCRARRGPTQILPTSRAPPNAPAALRAHHALLARQSRRRAQPACSVCLMMPHLERRRVEEAARSSLRTSQNVRRVQAARTSRRGERRHARPVQAATTAPPALRPSCHVPPVATRARLGLSTQATAQSALRARRAARARRSRRRARRARSQRRAASRSARRAWGVSTRTRRVPRSVETVWREVTARWVLQRRCRARRVLTPTRSTTRGLTIATRALLGRSARQAVSSRVRAVPVPSQLKAPTSARRASVASTRTRRAQQSVKTVILAPTVPLVRGRPYLVRQRRTRAMLTMSLQVTAHHALLVQLVQQAHTAQRAASLARMPPGMGRRRVTFALRGSSHRFRIAQCAGTAHLVTYVF
jgi:hypothetical protein